MSKEKFDSPIRMYLLVPVIKNKNGEEEKLLFQLQPEEQEHLGEIPFVFSSMLGAIDFFSYMQSESNGAFYKAYYVPVLYTDVIGLSVMSGFESGMFGVIETPESYRMDVTQKLVFPQDYGIDINKYDAVTTSNRILSLYNTPKDFAQYIKEETATIDESDIIPAVYDFVNNYMYHYLSLDAEEEILEKYNDALVSYFKKGNYQLLINMLDEFEAFMLKIDKAMEFVSENADFRDFLIELFQNPLKYHVEFSYDYSEGEEMLLYLLVERLIELLELDKGVDQMNGDDLIVLCSFLKSAFRDEYPDFLVDIMADYALTEILGYSDKKLYKIVKENSN